MSTINDIIKFSPSSLSNVYPNNVYKVNLSDERLKINFKNLVNDIDVHGGYKLVFDDGATEYGEDESPIAYEVHLNKDNDEIPFILFKVYKETSPYTQVTIEFDTKEGFKTYTYNIIKQNKKGPFSPKYGNISHQLYK